MSGWRESMYLATFGLALVQAMATVLFGLVGLNPKDADYGTRPWVYCGLCFVGAVICWRVSARLSRPSADPVD